MFVVSITYDSDRETGIARTFEHIEDARLFVESYIRNSSARETPVVNIVGV